MKCKRCGSHVKKRRAELGFNTCLPCGAVEAEKERARKARCVAPAYNKGAYQYVTSRSMASDVGK